MKTGHPSGGSRPLVSVVMAVFNQEATIDRAVTSILEQTFTDLELIIVDDGSTDGTLRKLTDFLVADPRITILENARNIGLGASLNRGWRASRGDLIARMDGDDISLPRRLELQVDFLERHTDVGVLGTAARLVKAGSVIGVAVRPAQHDVLTAIMPRETPFIHPSVMIRRTILEATNGYDETLRRAQDTDLWFRAERHCLFHNLVTPLIIYTVPDRPSLLAITSGTRVIVRNGFRRGQPVRALWWGFRWLAANLLTRARLAHVHLQ